MPPYEPAQRIAALENQIERLQKQTKNAMACSLEAEGLIAEKEKELMDMNMKRVMWKTIFFTLVFSLVAYSIHVNLPLLKWL